VEVELDAAAPQLGVGVAGLVSPKVGVDEALFALKPNPAEAGAAVVGAEKPKPLVDAEPAVVEFANTLAKGASCLADAPPKPVPAALVTEGVVVSTEPPNTNGVAGIDAANPPASVRDGAAAEPLVDDDPNPPNDGTLVGRAERLPSDADEELPLWNVKPAVGASLATAEAVVEGNAEDVPNPAPLRVPNMPPGDALEAVLAGLVDLMAVPNIPLSLTALGAGHDASVMEAESS